MGQTALRAFRELDHERDERITITAELTGSFVMTSVADGGSGIHDSEQTLIFEKFYRGKDHRNAVPGTGMGLPIARAIINAQRWLVVRYKPAGARLHFFLHLTDRVASYER